METDSMRRARDAVLGYVNDHIMESNDGDFIGYDDTYIIWFCDILKSWKALVGTTTSDDMYYEVTHDSHAKKEYINVYKKFAHVLIESYKEV